MGRKVWGSRALPVQPGRGRGKGGRGAGALLPEKRLVGGSEQGVSRAPLWVKGLGSVRRVGLAAALREDAQTQAHRAGQETRRSNRSSSQTRPYTDSDPCPGRRGEHRRLPRGYHHALAAGGEADARPRGGVSSLSTRGCAGGSPGRRRVRVREVLSKEESARVYGLKSPGTTCATRRDRVL